MTQNTTFANIIDCTVPLLAQHGYAGTTMRTVADAAGVKSSVLYYYFADKAVLMRAVRQRLTMRLDEGMHNLPEVADAQSLLRQRLWFQLDECEAIVCLLQYFMAVKADFPLQNDGYVPERAYQHMRDIIDRGVAEGCYVSDDPAFDAKTLTHLVNGFLLEYYPHTLADTDKDALTERLATFIERALKRIQ